MPQVVQRWTEVTASQFTHEAEGLSIVRGLLPDQPPFRAWSNFEFRDNHGKWHEIDLLVIGRRRIHLVELKFYQGKLRGNDRIWHRPGHRASDSPLLLAHRKAQRLKSRLLTELARYAQDEGLDLSSLRNTVPYVQESVLLHHPKFRCELAPESRLDLFGLDDLADQAGLERVSRRLLEAATPNEWVTEEDSATVAKLMERIGIMPRRQREAGSWVIGEKPLGEGDGWQDWPAFNRVVTTERVRIRFLISPPGTPTTEQARLRQVAEHEYRIMSRLQNKLLLCPKDMVQNDLGVGLVYPFDKKFQRLDLYLADKSGQLTTGSRLSLLKQAADAVSYAHRNRIVHRGLTPHAVLVQPLENDRLQVMVGDWQGAGAASGTTMTGLPSHGVTLSPGTGDTTGRPRPVPSDVDRRMAEAFQAPEGVWSRSADRVKIDVFALGALAYYVLSGRMPAADRTTLRTRLLRDGGLDLAADLPQVTPKLRDLVLDATQSQVTERLPDVRAFINRLDDAVAAMEESADEVIDPLEAPPGTVIDGRFRLRRRLGTGSTAAGLLVDDLTLDESGPAPARVLKVAIDKTADERLANEARVVSELRGSRLVRLIEGPIEVGGRQALLLESAGEMTLGEALRGRERLSLDLLERWGTDLLEALVMLDRLGIDHRDIKPANLGVREGRGDRARHLVLFDFSLSSAGATAVTAGTPPYLDPFLDSPSRGRYDSAAERYSAAVVLFEMATGATPRFGDGLSDPASVPDEATIDRAMFDPAVADSLEGFFRRSLARDSRRRHDTAAEMLDAWRAAFGPVPRTLPDDADALAAGAGLSTPLARSGLSARALSAVEPLAVTTVADLVAVDPVRLNHLSGVADATRREVKSRARQWRDRFGAEVNGRGPARDTTDPADDALPDPVTAAGLLLAHAGGPRATSSRALIRRVLGLDEGTDAFATHGELAPLASVTRARIQQHFSKLQNGWGSSLVCARLLDTVAEIAWQAMTDASGVATVAELTQSVLAVMPPADDAPAGSAGDDPGDDTAGPGVDRLAAGLLRFALDRSRERNRAEDDARQFVSRRRDGRIFVLAAEQALLDPAEALGRAADDLIDQGRAAGESLVPGSRAAHRLREVWDQAVGGLEPAPQAPDANRLLRLAVAMARRAVLAGSGDLYPRDMPAAAALALALAGVGAQPVGVREVRSRVRAKFPALPPLPDRPRLDQLISETGLGLVYDEDQRAYRPVTRASDTQGLTSRTPTFTGPVAAPLVADGPSGHRLAESAASRSFLALGVEARWLARAVPALADRFGAEIVDVTAVLIDAMKELATRFGLDWDFVQKADAAPEGTRDAEGLAVLVRRSLPSVAEAIEAAAASQPEGTHPLLLTDVSPLARYGHLNVLSEWADLATRRPQAIWVLVPQLAGSYGALIDRTPLPLAAPAQYLRLDPEWIASHSRVPASEGER